MAAMDGKQTLDCSKMPLTYATFGTPNQVTFQLDKAAVLHVQQQTRVVLAALKETLCSRMGLNGRKQFAP